MKNIFLAALLMTAPLPALADELPVFILSLHEHAFEPKELAVPAGQKIKLMIKNTDATPAEFESGELNREKVVAAGSEITVYVGPLTAGTYHYVDDFHRDTTTGTIIAQ